MRRVPMQDENIKGKCKTAASGPTSAIVSIPTLSTTTRPTEAGLVPASGSTPSKATCKPTPYGGYDGIYAKRDPDGSGQSIKEVACWALEDATSLTPRTPMAGLDAAMLTMVRDLYQVEDEAKAADRRDQGLHACRGRRHPPGPAATKRATAGDDRDGWIPSRSWRSSAQPMAAMTYMLDQWEALKVCTPTSSTSTTTPPNALAADRHRTKELALHRP